MKRRRLADISHLGKSAMLCLISCWRRAVAAPPSFPVFRLPILLNPSQTFGTTALPLRPAERSILFSEKSVRCPTARKARLVRTRRKKDAERGKSAKQTCTSGSPFFAYFLWRSKESKSPAPRLGAKVNTTPQANHKAQTHFQAALSCKQRQPETHSLNLTTKTSSPAQEKSKSRPNR